MRIHVKVVAWLHLVLGFLGFALAFGLLLLAGGGALADVQKTGPLSGSGLFAFGFGLFSMVAALALPYFATGYGLLRERAWARPLGIVLGAIHLLFVPVGTAMGIYSLWVLISVLRADPAAPALVVADAPVAALERVEDRRLGHWLGVAVVLGIFGAALIAAVLLGLPFVTWVGGASTVVTGAVVLGLLSAVTLAIFFLGSAREGRSRAVRHEQAILHALDRNRGRLTVLEASRMTGLAVEECESILTRLTRRSHLQLDVDGGTSVYRVLV